MHAWYLVEKSMIFSLFGSVSNKAKRAIADELRLTLKSFDEESQFCNRELMKTQLMLI